MSSLAARGDLAPNFPTISHSIFAPGPNNLVQNCKIYPICNLQNRHQYPLSFLRGFDPQTIVDRLRAPSFHSRLSASLALESTPIMPPKKAAADQPKKARATVEDKTFGMKNKKGGAAAKQIAQLQAQSKSNKSPEEKRKEAEKEARAKEKAAAEAAKKEAADLFKPVQVQKVPFGVDPKTVLCQFFKAGTCEKGKKCKFSHDLEVGRKGQKKDLYQDTREDEKEEKEKDQMDDWDEEKLRKVVLSKHGNPKTTTDKVCKYFIQAVEDGKYGWFWTCPNGGNNCMYRHSLPPG
jgi:hypothetical protein